MSCQGSFVSAGGKVMYIYIYMYILCMCIMFNVFFQIIVCGSCLSGCILPPPFFITPNLFSPLGLTPFTGQPEL